MGYIGNRPADSYTSFAVQHFTTSATTTYTLDNPVANENEIALFINNVRQEPGSSYAYTASGTTLTLSAATSASDTMYCVFIGKAVQTVTPANGSVTGAMMSYPLTNFSSTGIDDNATSTALTIASDGRNTVDSTNEKPLVIHHSDGSTVNMGFQNNSSNAHFLGFANSDLVLAPAGTERMRIDSSGNVLIGQTSASTSDDGHYFQPTGTAIHVANSNRSLDLYRLTDNGDTLNMYQGSTICGRIGTISSNAMYISAPNNDGGGFLFSNNASTIYPTRRTSGTVSLSDNTNDLGAQVWRFNDAYITNGVTTGSDQNEKQQIQLLTDSEIAVAKRISKGFKTFKWNSAVEEKGDNARTHTGVIAQEVQQAFADEGLDVTKYAFFMSNTYWEKERVIPAVEEITDEEGNITQEAQPEHTVIDKWEVESEAPEGAVQKTRLGIRYPELLSFVSSAFEQRLTNIETRLEALENA